MTVAVLATVSRSATTLWYLTRSTGIVAFVLLTASVLLGILASVGWTSERWPRFVSQALHRNLSLFCLVLVAVHVLTTVADGFVPIHLIDAFVPFLQHYRPIWIGLGALAFDMLLAVLVTSALRRRIGYGRWRAVHWLAYLSWPVAVFHELGSGSDVHLAPLLLLNVACLGAVLAAVVWRLAGAPMIELGWRVGAGGAAILVVIGLVAFAAVGPLRPNWSHRSGTSPALLRQISLKFASSGSTAAPSGQQPTTGGATSAPPTSPPTSTAGGSDGLPSLPFSEPVSGTFSSSTSRSTGQVQVVLSMQAQGTTSTPLVVTLIGTPVDGGVSMTSSQVRFGAASGVVTSLDGTSLAATVRGPTGVVYLTMQLNLNQAAGTITGTVDGASSPPGERRFGGEGTGR